MRYTWTLVVECRGKVIPEDLDEDIIRELESLMMGLTLEFGHWKLRCFGQFVHYVTGKPNPHRLAYSPTQKRDVYCRKSCMFNDSPYAELITIFLRYQDEELKETTIKSMANGINCCLDILMESGLDGEMEDITSDMIRVIQAKLSDVKRSTAQAYLRDLGYFLEFYMDRNVVLASCMNWKRSRENVTHVFLKVEVVNRLLEAADPLERLIVMFECTMGLRRTEMAYLCLDDIHDGRMTIHGKDPGEGEGKFLS